MLRKLRRFVVVAFGFGLVIEVAGLVAGEGFGLLAVAAVGMLCAAALEGFYLLPNHVKPWPVRLLLYAAAYTLTMKAGWALLDKDYGGVSALLSGLFIAAFLTGLDALNDRIGPWAERQQERLDAEGS